MGQQVEADEGGLDVGNHKPPREVPAKTKVEVEGQPSIGGDGGPVGREKVVVDASLAALPNAIFSYFEL
jgi:hypothetical protein